MPFPMYVLQSDDHPFFKWLSHGTPEAPAFLTLPVIFTPAVLLTPVNFRTDRF